jgi:hypothetical protein
VLIAAKKGQVSFTEWSSAFHPGLRHSGQAANDPIADTPLVGHGMIIQRTGPADATANPQLSLEAADDLH